MCYLASLLRVTDSQKYEGYQWSMQSKSQKWSFSINKDEITNEFFLLNCRKDFKSSRHSIY